MYLILPVSFIIFRLRVLYESIQARKVDRFNVAYTYKYGIIYRYILRYGSSTDLDDIFEGTDDGLKYDF